MPRISYKGQYFYILRDLFSKLNKTSSKNTDRQDLLITMITRYIYNLINNKRIMYKIEKVIDDYCKSEEIKEKIISHAYFNNYTWQYLEVHKTPEKPVVKLNQCDSKDNVIIDDYKFFKYEIKYPIPLDIFDLKKEDLKWQSNSLEEKKPDA